MDEEVLSGILNNVQDFLSMHEESDQFDGVLCLGYKQTETLCKFFQIVSSDIGFDYKPHRHYNNARYGNRFREVVQKEPPSIAHL